MITSDTKLHRLTDVRRRDIPLEEIQPDPDQPRREFSDEALQELAASLQRHGQMEAILVHQTGPDAYRLISGERRWRAARLAGQKTLRADIVERSLSRSELQTWQLVANSQRRDLTPLEQLEAYLRLQQETGVSNSELATLLCVSRSTVTRVLSLQKLSADQRELLRRGKLSSAAAYALTRLPESEQAAAAAAVAEGRLDRRSVEDRAAVDRSANAVVSRSVTLETAGGSVRYRSEQAITIVSLLETLVSLTRELRKARAEGLDIRTLAGVLRDRVAQNRLQAEDAS